MMHATRRDFMRASAALAMATGVTRTAPAQNAEQGALFAERSGADGQRTLLRGGSIISMDAAVGDLEAADLLIEGTRIAAIASSIDAPDAQVVDATDAILIPGFVDAHRHAWEGQLRRINPNAATIGSYMAATHQGFAPYYRPTDHYVGNTITALGCIDAGITCIIDNSHNSRSSEHSDEAIRALFDTGIRAVHASGAPQFGEWDRQWPQDLERLQTRYFSSSDQLVTLRMFSGIDADNWELARRLGLSISTEFGGNAADALEPFWADNLMGPWNTLNHCGLVPDSTWERIRDNGVSVNICPRSDTQYGLQNGFPPFQKALDFEARPGFSVDNETSYSTDMFTEMRTAFHIQRGMAANRRALGDPSPPRPVSIREILACATINGARCAGLSDKIGTLTPGKEADVVMIRTDAINLYPSNHAVGTVVSAAESRNVDTVIIGGKVRKYGGQVVGLDMDAFRRMVDESRAYLFESAGYSPDIFALEFGI